MNYDLALRTATLVIAVSALIVSFFSWKSSRVTIRLTIKNSYMTALFDIDKQLINNPDLWTIYDKYPEGLQKGLDAKSVGQRRAFIFYHFNLFEVTFTNFTSTLKLNAVDREFWRSMKKYISDFFRDSSEARGIFNESSTQDLYLPSFVEYLNLVIGQAEQEAVRLNSQPVVAAARKDEGSANK